MQNVKCKARVRTKGFAFSQIILVRLVEHYRSSLILYYVVYDGRFYNWQVEKFQVTYKWCDNFLYISHILF